MDGVVPLARHIGKRVRRERQTREWTLDQLVHGSGVSRRMLINIEQGVANPSIGILLKLTEALGVGLAELVDAPTPTAVQMTPSGAGALLWSGEAGGHGVLVASTKPPDIMELWDWQLGPGDCHDSEAHSAGTRELLHVLEGAMEMQVAEEVFTLQVGDALSFPGDVPHAYTNPHPSLVRFSLSVFEPTAAVSPRGRALTDA